LDKLVHEINNPLLPVAGATIDEQQLWSRIQETLGPKLLETEELLHDFTLSNVPIMQELLDHISGSRGKRLRPILLLLSAGFKPANDYLLIKAAAAVELIHTASLIHDDIIDESSERRGRATLNAGFGNSSAVLAGDFLFARAFELLALCGDFELNKLLTRAVGTMCEGEIEQRNCSYNFQLTEEQYLRNIYRKTAALMEVCCSSGARLSKLEDDALQQFEAYGRNLGYAFQIIDDVLDITGDPSVTGKPVGNDLREGTVTLPVIYVLQDPQWGSYLEEVISAGDFSSRSLDFLLQPSCIEGPVAKAVEKAASYAREARECLRDFENNPSKTILEDIAGYVLQRKK
jgi:heptaprenyl diphosphate synthase